jgi:hypothetical protein
MKTSEQVRAQIVDVFRRDLIGPGPQDTDDLPCFFGPGLT